MAGRQDVLDMLQQAGAERLPSGTTHLKFRLPNRKMFIAPSTPSDRFSWDNSLAQLRRALRESHPEIADHRKNYTPPKRSRIYSERSRVSGVRLGELLANNASGFNLSELGFEMTIPTSIAIPGSQVMRPVPYSNVTEVPAPAVEPEVEAQALPAYKPPRVKHEPKPKPGAVKTLTAEQLAEANRRLHAQGQAACDAYINECHHQLVPVTQEIARERRVEVTTTEEEDEMHPMQGLVERAETELKAVTDRIAGYEAQVLELRAKVDSETEKQLKLEQFIEKHKKLIEESADVLQLLPALPVAEIRRIQKPAAAKKDYSNGFRDPNVFFGIRDIREIYIPHCRRTGKKEFTTDEVIAFLGRTTDKKLPIRPKMANTIFAGIRDVKNGYRKGQGRGVYEVMEASS